MGHTNKADLYVMTPFLPTGDSVCYLQGNGKGLGVGVGLEMHGGHTSSQSKADLYVMTLSGLTAFCSLGTYGRSLWRMASTRASTWSSPTTLAHSLHRPTRRPLESRTCTHTDRSALLKCSWLKGRERQMRASTSGSPGL